MDDALVLEELSQGTIHILPTIVRPKHFDGCLELSGDHSMKFADCGGNITFMGDDDAIAKSVVEHVSFEHGQLVVVMRPSRYTTPLSVYHAQSSRES
ncbi:hypothetical protein ACE6H2_012102 [Prunus campanulata]